MDSIETTKYYLLVTERGMSLEAQALGSESAIEIVKVSYGDLTEVDPTDPSKRRVVIHSPTGAETALYNPWFETNPDSVEVSPEESNVFIVKSTIPAASGGAWVREYGIWAKIKDSTDDPILFAYGTCADYYKITALHGHGVVHKMTIPFTVTNGIEVVPGFDRINPAIATRDNLGIIKVGSGLDIDQAGTLGIDPTLTEHIDEITLQVAKNTQAIKDIDIGYGNLIIEKDGQYVGEFNANSKEDVHISFTDHPEDPRVDKLIEDFEGLGNFDADLVEIFEDSIKPDYGTHPPSL